MKILDKIVISPTPPSSKNVAWFDGKGIKIPNQGEWKSTGGSGGNGIEIVESVDKLSADAPVGSVAVVTVQGTAKEQSFRDLFQPTPDMLDQASGTILNAERLSSVTSLNIFAPSSLEGLEMVGVYIVPRTFSTTNQNMMALFVHTEMGLVARTASEAGYGQLELVTYPEGTPVINQEAIDQINATLASGDWCYFGNPESPEGITETQFNTVDKFVKAIFGVSSTAEIYLKKDSWKKLYAEDLEKLTTEITKLDGIKADSIKFGDFSYGSKLMNPNIYYKYTNGSTRSLTFVLTIPKDQTVYLEYMLQLRCESAPSSVKFTIEDGTELSINWANGVAPTFVQGMTYLISIANGFGVYSMFPNS